MHTALLMFAKVTLASDFTKQQFDESFDINLPVPDPETELTKGLGGTIDNDTLDGDPGLGNDVSSVAFVDKALAKRGTERA